MPLRFLHAMIDAGPGRGEHCPLAFRRSIQRRADASLVFRRRLALDDRLVQPIDRVTIDERGEEVVECLVMAATAATATAAGSYLPLPHRFLISCRASDFVLPI